MTEVDPQRTSESSARGDTAEVARGGMLNIGGAISHHAARLLLTLVIGRILGSRGVGYYFEALAFYEVLSLVAAGGFQATLVRYVSTHRAQDESSELHGTVRLAVALPVAWSVVLALALFLLAPLIALEIFEQPPLEELLRVVAVALPFGVATKLLLAATQGFRSMRQYTAIGMVWEPWTRLIVSGAILVGGGTVRDALFGLIVAGVTAALLGLRSLVRLMPRLNGSAVYRPRELLNFSFFAWGSALAIDAFIWADSLLIALFGTPSDVGVYQVATRVVALGALFVLPLSLAFNPLIADLYARQRLAQLRRLYRTVVGWTWRVSIPGFMLLLLVPEVFLGLFGEGFTVGSFVTITLTLGALAHASTGPANSMLTMTGHPGRLLTTMLGTLVLNVALNVWLIPAYGINGAAIAWAVSLVAMNVVLVWQLHVILRAWPFGSTTLKGLVAGAIGFATGAVIDLVSDAGVVTAAAMVAALLAYALATRILGISDGERSVVRTALARLGRGQPSVGDEPVAVLPEKGGRPDR